MDPSALIFLALAVAWAVYLVPKALQHHDEVARSRSVDRFSHTMRVLARREPVDRRNARLVVQPGRPASARVVTTKVSAAAPARPEAARREAARLAARRRRRVLGALALVNVVVIALAAFSVLAWGWVAAPVALLVAWLVACRLMVRQERSAAAPARGRAAHVPSRRLPIEVEEEDEQEDAEDHLAAPAAAAHDEVVTSAMEDTSSMAAVRIDPTLWDPVPVTLPTYVTKPAATRRTVRTISLDDSGVWTSGRTEVDAAIAREADEADKAARASRTAEGDDHRAVGS